MAQGQAANLIKQRMGSTKMQASPSKASEQAQTEKVGSTEIFTHQNNAANDVQSLLKIDAMYSSMIPSAIGPSSSLMNKEFQEVRDYIFDIKQNDRETNQILRYLNTQNRLFNMELEIEDFYDVELEDGAYCPMPKRPQRMGKAGFLQEM